MIKCIYFLISENLRMFFLYFERKIFTKILLRKIYLCDIISYFKHVFLYLHELLQDVCNNDRQNSFIYFSHTDIYKYIRKSNI